MSLERNREDRLNIDIESPTTTQPFIYVNDQNDDASIISGLSLYSEFDDLEVCDTDFSSPPPCCGYGKDRVSVCNIQMMDDHQGVLDETPCWFRVSFRGSDDFAELEGEEVLEFCSALMEYEGTWLFDLTLMSSGVSTNLESQHVVDTLEFLLSRTAIPPTSDSLKPRFSWQQDWPFHED